MLALVCLAILHGALAVSDSFTSTPNCSRPVCPNEPVYITCTHNDSSIPVTAWSGIPPGGEEPCGANVISSDSDSERCSFNGSVFFEAVANAAPGPNCLSSTATIASPASFVGYTVECRNVLGNQINLIGSCAVSTSATPPAAVSGLSLSEADIVETTGSSPSPRTWELMITLRWEAAASDAGVAQYTVSSNLLAAVNTTNTELTVSVGLGMSYTFTVVATDVCGLMGMESEQLIVNVDVPEAPGSIMGRFDFNQSSSSFSLALQWPVVDPPTPAIAMRGGDTLISGAIRDYTITLPNSVPMTVPVNCNATTCSSPVLQGVLCAGVSELTVSVAAANALGEGEPRQGGCSNFVAMESASSLTDVTLTCPVEPCSITYRGSSQNVDMVGTSGEPLQNLTAGEQYTYTVTFRCGGFAVTVTDSFITCKCPVSALFGSAAVDDVTCPLPGFAGAVRPIQNTNGVVCYDGTADSSQAVFMCSESGATCSTGDCAAECQCEVGQESGSWSLTFPQQANCVVSTTPPATAPTAQGGLSTGAIVGIVVGIVALAVVLVAIIIVVLWLFCCRARSVTIASPPDPGPVYDEVVPAEKFQVEANAAYGPVKRDPGPAYEEVRPAEAFEMEGNAAYGPVRP